MKELCWEKIDDQKATAVAKCVPKEANTSMQ